MPPTDDGGRHGEPSAPADSLARVRASEHAWVRPAVTAADYRSVADLMREYVASLSFELDFQDFTGELARLDEEFGPPHGAAFLAESAGAPVGVAAIRRIGHDITELKRMYLRPEARGMGLGRLLTGHAVAAAVRMGAARMVLDTDVDTMPAANALYRSLGFADTAPYRHNPLPGARFLSLDLVTLPRPQPIGVVLAGGASTRMGVDKSRLLIGGRSMIDHVLAAFAVVGLEPVVAGGPPHESTATVPDPHDMAGPSAGLAAAFRRHPGADAVVVGADQPYIAAGTLQRLLVRRGDAVVPFDRKRQATCAVYRDPCSPMLERLAPSDPAPSLQHLLDEVDAVVVPPETWRRWGEDGRSWLSIDTPEALAAAREAWPEPAVSSLDR